MICSHLQLLCDVGAGTIPSFCTGGAENGGKSDRAVVLPEPGRDGPGSESAFFLEMSICAGKAHVRSYGYKEGR